MQDEANAEVEVYISKDQHRDLTLNKDKVPKEIWLTNGDATLLLAKYDEVSEMTGSARELKANHTPIVR